MTSTPSRRRSVLSALAFLALVVAACGGSETTDTEATTGTPETSMLAETTTSTAEATTSSEHDDDHNGEDEHEGETGEGKADREVEVVMSEFAFEPSDFTVSAGETVKFVLHNEGAVPHEFRLSNAHRIEEHLEAGHEDHGEDGGHHEEGGDVLIEVEAGESAELVFTFPDDATLYTEVACLLPGHYEAGMSAPLAYTES